MFSPDGRWVAYDSVENGGASEIYVQPFPRRPDSQKLRLSTSTGHWPQWSRDGRRVVYSTTDYRYMVVDVNEQDGQLRAFLPRELFQVRQSQRGHHVGFDPRTGHFLLQLRPERDANTVPS